MVELPATLAVPPIDLSPQELTISAVCEALLESHGDVCESMFRRTELGTVEPAAFVPIFVNDVICFDRQATLAPGDRLTFTMALSGG